MSEDIWVLHYQGRIGLFPLTEKGREWLAIHGHPIAKSEAVWMTDMEFTELHLMMANDGISVLEGMDDEKGPDA